jgi:hypothetical protein
MFVQVITGRTKDAAALQRQADRWRTEVRPGAAGFLGGTGGIADDGTVIFTARFEDEASARVNSQRPEQSAWWNETAQCFDGEPTFRESTDTDLLFGGGSDEAHFVQAMEGRVLDRAKAEALEAGGILEQMRSARPDVIGGLRVWFPDGRYLMLVYFTSEEKARRGEMSQEFADAQSEYESQFTDVTFIDLRRPIFT